MKHSWRSPCVHLSLAAAAGRDSSDQPALQSNDLWDWIWNFQKSNRKRRWLTPSQGRDLILYYNTLLHKPVRNGYRKQTFLKSSALSHSPEGLLFPLLKMFITSLNEPDPPPPTPHPVALLLLQHFSVTEKSCWTISISRFQLLFFPSSLCAQETIRKEHKHAITMLDEWDLFQCLDPNDPSLQLFQGMKCLLMFVKYHQQGTLSVTIYNRVWKWCNVSKPSGIHAVADFLKLIFIK